MLKVCVFMEITQEVRPYEAKKLGIVCSIFWFLGANPQI